MWLNPGTWGRTGVRSGEVGVRLFSVDVSELAVQDKVGTERPEGRGDLASEEGVGEDGSVLWNTVGVSLGRSKQGTEEAVLELLMEKGTEDSGGARTLALQSSRKPIGSMP